VKRRDIIKAIRTEAKRQDVEWSVLREGANHTVYRLGSTRIPVPRHNEIGPGLTEQIFSETEAELGRRWWR
jgi:hypothetical protein